MEKEFKKNANNGITTSLFALQCEVYVDEKKAEEMNNFVYLGCIFTRDGKVEMDVKGRVNAGNKANGVLNTLCVAK